MVSPGQHSESDTDIGRQRETAEVEIDRDRQMNGKNEASVCSERQKSRDIVSVCMKREREERE